MKASRVDKGINTYLELKMGGIKNVLYDVLIMQLTLVNYNCVACSMSFYLMTSIHTFEYYLLA